MALISNRFSCGTQLQSLIGKNFESLIGNNFYMETHIRVSPILQLFINDLPHLPGMRVIATGIW